MREAIKCARENLTLEDGGPFGAVVVLDGKIIGRGHNMVLKNNDPSAHAEIVAIRDACSHLKSYDLSGCELYASSYPCPMCLSAIMWANIDTVYYSNTLEETAKIGFRDDFIYDYLRKSEADEIDGEVLKLHKLKSSEASEVYRKFMEKEKKTMY
ncbi:MAG TPA: nucleoside deaminase [Firmicutes bacterium]|nr:nucleoside deaminase [Bacillota bacterium]